ASAIMISVARWSPCDNSPTRRWPRCARRPCSRSSSTREATRARSAAREVESRIAELLATGGLAAKADGVVGELSHGDQRATEILMALALRPRLLLLDEPTAGMGDQETHDVAQLIRRLHRNQALTIVLIEHDMRVVFHLADRITVLAEGSVLAEGAPDAIAANEAVQAAYLGKAA
ncbi:MAG: ATP-binding cassette domain-containing protein, partial [Methylobacteriaceae bacterium]|nr:ATP-binding cassette domain-containing protein [Methylobacteriaceae bacterium]